MSKLNLSVLAQGFKFQEPDLVNYKALDGGLGKYRLDMIGRATRIVSVAWLLGGTDYETLRQFYLDNLNADCPTFEIDLILDLSSVQEYSGVRFVPDTMKLTDYDGINFGVTCNLEVPPLAGTTDTWPSGGSFVMTHLPQKQGYAVADGRNALSAIMAGNQSIARRNRYNSAREVDVTWLTDAAGYDYLMQAYRAWSLSGGKLFSIDLIMDKSYLTTHKASIVPGSFGLSSQKGNSYTVSAKLEAQPTPYLPA